MMNKLITSLLLATIGCSYTSDKSLEIIERREKSIIEVSDTLCIDIKSSEINWKGTKMRGLGKHEGTIDLESGYFLRINEKGIVGGEFVINMKTIEVTDIPIDDPIPRRLLVDHLKDPDFFDVETFPYSVLEIKSIIDLNGRLKALGLLTIKGLQHPIDFEVVLIDDGYYAKIVLDRFKWNVAYEGSLLDRTLVDREIELVVNLKVAECN